jgi:hypothetical protein
LKAATARRTAELDVDNLKTLQFASIIIICGIGRNTSSNLGKWLFIINAEMF